MVDDGVDLVKTIPRGHGGGAEPPVYLPHPLLFLLICIFKLLCPPLSLFSIILNTSILNRAFELVMIFLKRTMLMPEKKKYLVVRFCETSVTEAGIHPDRSNLPLLSSAWWCTIEKKQPEMNPLPPKESPDNHKALRHVFSGWVTPQKLPLVASLDHDIQRWFGQQSMKQQGWKLQFSTRKWHIAPSGIGMSCLLQTKEFFLGISGSCLGVTATWTARRTGELVQCQE